MRPASARSCVIASESAFTRLERGDHLVETPWREIDSMSISRTDLQAMRVAWIGIDVSKKKLDGAIWLGGKRYRSIKVDNDPAGHTALLA